MRHLASIVAIFAAIPASAGPAGQPVTAATTLDAAVTALQREHVHRDRVDWTALIADARARIGAAERVEAAYPAIRAIIAALGEKHTSLVTSADPPPPAAAKPAPFRAEMHRGRFGYLAVPRYAGSRERGAAYARTLREGLRDLDTRGACGFVLDLRGNGGGNVLPMLDGVGALVGRELLFSFDVPGVGVFPVRWRDGQAVQDGATPGPRPSIEPDARISTRPVALLIDGGTASSAEALLVAFAGRPATRRFGAPTADDGSVNNSVALPGGAMLLVTVGWNRDAAGRRLDHAIVPDEATPRARVMAAAEAWLARQPACRRR